MSIIPAKGIPLTKAEVALLINLVLEHKVIISKLTNATNNRLKEEAWNNVTESFNAIVSSCPRKLEQLRLKWENLKKAARKRSLKIRMMQLKTGGCYYAPPDDALDRVASILNEYYDGYSPTLCSDSEVPIINDSDSSNIQVCGDGCSVEGESCEGGSSNYEGSDWGNNGCPTKEPNNNVGCNVTQTSKQKFFTTSTSGSNINQQRRKIIDKDIRARTIRNKAMTEYYNTRRRKLELEMENIKLRNQLLKLELEKHTQKPKMINQDIEDRSAQNKAITEYFNTKRKKLEQEIEIFKETDE
ncbi:hypothetical protein evm_007060 [Chilo suppressalis]|nr:hypothetical protein evm_007060 [Chilo suppressalis]